MMGRLSNTAHRQHSHNNMPAAVRTIYYTTLTSSSKKIFTGIHLDLTTHTIFIRNAE
jgi:hypothetical protein